jgi:predicted phage terminase large subunit-like protein
MIPKAHCERYAVIDLAASIKTWADWCVLSIWDWHRDTQNLVLVHMDRQRVESSQHIIWAKNLCNQWGVERLGIEERTFGLTLIQHFQRAGGFYVRPLFPKDRDKVQRAIPYGAAIASQQVWFPKAAPWLYIWEQEHRNFPNAKHDDMVDTGAYAWEMTRSMPAYAPHRKKMPTIEDLCFKQIEDRKNRKPDDWSYMMR